MLELIDKGRCTDEHSAPLLFVHGGYHAAFLVGALFAAAAAAVGAVLLRTRQQAGVGVPADVTAS